eukprot:CAMPEP_0179156294 /NCGR_PEP_ID=MMETSP0796-20121207/76187_1 /TAXON_ID=73915 /ORGANISM="Pyrodinium bahamense, Strain pbaha01" /LENGTH=39 /DNA_ID= /DNA_START= /DNA_END= /DNA_ORIENTATION=
MSCWTVFRPRPPRLQLAARGRVCADTSNDADNNDDDHDD